MARDRGPSVPDHNTVERDNDAMVPAASEFLIRPPDFALESTAGSAVIVRR